MIVVLSQSVSRLAAEAACPWPANSGSRKSFSILRIVKLQSYTPKRLK